MRSSDMDYYLEKYSKTIFLLGNGEVNGTLAFSANNLPFTF